MMDCQSLVKQTYWEDNTMQVKYESLDGRSCKDEIYRMGIGAAYSDGNLNFATASEDDEVYTKKKVSRVSHELVLCAIGSITSTFASIAARH